LGINPFNQPDVQLAKDLAKKVMSEQKTKKATGTSAETDANPVSVGGNELSGALQNWIAQARLGDYISLQAYLPPTREVTAALQELRQILRGKSRLATTMGYGPRFLHSTGQLHKGGPNTGLFLQLLDEPAADLDVPETSYSFAALIRAQAQGDFQALKQRGRRVVRLQLGGNIQNGLTQLLQAARTLKSELASGQSAA
jgi:transaldolase/glucose-6-phosphate isomerase